MSLLSELTALIMSLFLFGTIATPCQAAEDQSCYNPSIAETSNISEAGANLWRDTFDDPRQRAFVIIVLVSFVILKAISMFGTKKS